MVERRLLSAVGSFDDSFLYCEDYDLWCRLAIRRPVRVERTPLSCIRAHGGHYTGDRPAVYESWAQLYGKLAGLVQEPRLKALCARRRAEQIVIVSRIHAAKHRPLRGLRALVSARRYGWRYANWWLAMAKVLTQTVFPQR